MRKVISVFLLFIAVNTVFAQYHKNDLKTSLYFMPLIGNAAESKSLESSSGLVLRPSLGYYISDSSSLELNFTYGFQKNIEINDVNSEYQSFVFVLNYRKTFVNKEKIAVFTEAGIGLGAVKYYATSENSNSETHRELSGGVFVYNIGVGATCFLSKRVGVEVILPYVNTSNITSSYFRNLFSGFGPTIGVTFKI